MNSNSSDSDPTGSELARWPDPVFTRSDVRVVPLDERHGPQLQQLFEQCEDYFDLVFGLPPGPAEAQSAFLALPEGSTYDDKFLLGVVDPNDHLIGHLDVVRDHPSPATWTIGVFLLIPDCRRQGTGRSILNALTKWIASQGGKELRIGVVSWNEPAISFLQTAGFSVVEERPGFHSGAKEGIVVILRRPVVQT